MLTYGISTTVLRGDDFTTLVQAFGNAVQWDCGVVRDDSREERVHLHASSLSVPLAFSVSNPLDALVRASLSIQRAPSLAFDSSMGPRTVARTMRRRPRLERDAASGAEDATSRVASPGRGTGPRTDVRWPGSLWLVRAPSAARACSRRRCPGASGPRCRAPSRTRWSRGCRLRRGGARRKRWPWCWPALGRS